MAITTVKFSLCSSAAFLLILMALSTEPQTVRSQSQTCSGELSNLSICAPFVVPGTTLTSPSTECCSALQQVDQGCLCNTLRIAARMPTACHLPPVTCAA